MSEVFRIEVQDDVIAVQGDLDAQTAHQLDGAIDGVVADGRRTVTLDLAELEFVDSSGLRSMVLARGEDGEREVVLRSPSESVVRLLDIAGLADVFVIDPSA